MNSFLDSEYVPASESEAGFHVIPVPYERTVSYVGGTAAGPAAILEASRQLECFDGHGFPGEHGIFTADEVDCNAAAEEVMLRIGKAVGRALDHAALPVVLGGEHTVTFGAVYEFWRRNIDFGVLHFDAHADLRDSYEGSKWSHASVIRRVCELGVPVFQLGIRSLCREEIEYRKQKNICFLDGVQLADNPGNFKLPSDFPKKLYITFDIDAFDASLMPATGTPEPGGLFWWQSIKLLESAISDRGIIGFDVVELAPMRGLHHCDYTAAKLVYFLMGMAERSCFD